MYLILLTILCGLATIPHQTNAAKIPPHETVQEGTHLTDVSSNNGSEDEFLYLIASDEGGAVRLTQDDFNVTPEGHFVDIDKNKNSAESTEAHEISLGTPDIPKQVLHSVLDEIAFAVEDDPVVRETIKTSLKSGEIPVEVLTPGHKSNDENAILIEVFHLEDEEEEKSVDGLGVGDHVASTEEPITVTTAFLTESNDDFQTTDIPAADLSELFPSLEKDVEKDEESVEETRKRRNSEQSTMEHFLGTRKENEKVEMLLSDKMETERTHENFSSDKVSSTTLAAGSDMPIIMPSTAKRLSGFESNTQGWTPIQVFDFVTRKYAEIDEEGQWMTLPSQNHEASSTNDNIHSITISPSFINLMDSEKDTDDDENSNRKEIRQIEVIGESNEDFVATTEVIGGSEDSLFPLPGVDQIKTQKLNENEKDTDGNNEQRNDYITDLFRLNADGQSEKTYFQTRDELSAYKENTHNTEDRLEAATVFSEAKLGQGKRKDIIQREKRQLDDSSNLSTVNEEVHAATILPLMLASSTNESSEDGSTDSNEEETTTSSLDGDSFTTTQPLESEITTTAEGNSSTLDSDPTSGEGTTTSVSGEETTEIMTSVSSAEEEDNLVMMEKIIGNELSSTKFRIGNAGGMEFYDI